MGIAASCARTFALEAAAASLGLKPAGSRKRRVFGGGIANDINHGYYNGYRKLRRIHTRGPQS